MLKIGALLLHLCVNQTAEIAYKRNPMKMNKHKVLIIVFLLLIKFAEFVNGIECLNGVISYHPGVESRGLHSIKCAEKKGENVCYGAKCIEDKNDPETNAIYVYDCEADRNPCHLPNGIEAWIRYETGLRDLHCECMICNDSDNCNTKFLPFEMTTTLLPTSEKEKPTKTVPEKTTVKKAPSKETEKGSDENRTKGKRAKMMRTDSDEDDGQSKQINVDTQIGHLALGHGQNGDTTLVAMTTAHGNATLMNGLGQNATVESDEYGQDGGTTDVTTELGQNVTLMNGLGQNVTFERNEYGQNGTTDVTMEPGQNVTLMNGLGQNVTLGTVGTDGYFEQKGSSRNGTFNTGAAGQNGTITPTAVQLGQNGTAKTDELGQSGGTTRKKTGHGNGILGTNGHMETAFFKRDDLETAPVKLLPTNNLETKPRPGHNGHTGPKPHDTDDGLKTQHMGIEQGPKLEHNGGTLHGPVKKEDGRVASSDPKVKGVEHGFKPSAKMASIANDQNTTDQQTEKKRDDKTDQNGTGTKVGNKHGNNTQAQEGKPTGTYGPNHNVVMVDKPPGSDQKTAHGANQDGIDQAHEANAQRKMIDTMEDESESSDQETDEDDNSEENGDELPTADVLGRAHQLFMKMFGGPSGKEKE